MDAIGQDLRVIPIVQPSEGPAIRPKTRCQTIIVAHHDHPTRWFFGPYVSGTAGSYSKLQPKLAEAPFVGIPEVLSPARGGGKLVNIMLTGALRTVYGETATTPDPRLPATTGRWYFGS